MGKQYEMAFSIGAKVQGNFGAAFQRSAGYVQSLQSSIESLHKRQSNISSYQKTEQAIEKTRAKLALYQQQYANLKDEIERNGQATAAEQNALLAKGKAIDDLKDKEAQLASKLESTGNALQNEGIDLNNLGQASSETASQIETLRSRQEEMADSANNAQQATSNMADSLMDVVAATGAVETLEKVEQAFRECAEAAISFEADMAAVKRTVGGDDAFISDLGESFKELSTQIPITASELSKIASTAGQLGIAQDKVEEFTTVMAKLATTTDLTADEAATMLAQFANITGVTDYQRLGSVVAQLGDSTATTASKVVQMSQGMAAAASIAGMSETDIMAIAAAVGSLGIEAQAGSTSMSQLINTLYKATETGEKLSEFASVAGMTAEQFKKAWQDDAVSAMNAFITGLNDVERNGRSAIVILDELGISNVRQQKAILGLASAGDLLSNTISQANSAWAENTALNEKAGIMYETTQARLTMLGNAFQNIKIAIGDAFTPVISGVADGLNSILEPTAKWIEMNPALVKGIGTAIAIMGGMVAALAAYTVAAKAAAAASAALVSAIPGAKVILGITAGLSLLTGAVVALSTAAQEAEVSNEEFTENFNSLNDSMRESQHIYDLAQDYKRLSTETDHAVKVMKNHDFSDISISIGATADPTIIPDEFLINDDHNVAIEGSPEESVDADLLLDEDGNVITVVGSPEESVDADLLLDEDGNIVMIEGSPEQSVDADLLLDEDGNYVDVNGNPVQTVDPDLLLINGDHNVDVEGNPVANFDATALVNGVVDGVGQVPLEGVPGNKKVKDDDLVDNNGVMIHAEPDGSLLLDANVLVNKETPVTIHAQWDNLSTMEQDVENLKAKALEAKGELEKANKEKADLEGWRDVLQKRLSAAETDHAKSYLSEQLVKVNEAISEQTKECERCEEAYQKTAGQYIVTANAADTLKDRIRDLKEIEGQLSEVAAGDAESHAEDAKAMQDKAEAAAMAAAAEKKSAIASGALQYSSALKREAEANSQYAASMDEAKAAQQAYDNYVKSPQGRIRTVYNGYWSKSGDAQVRDAEKTLEKINSIIEQNPSQFTQWWSKGDFGGFATMFSLETMIDQIAPTMQTYADRVNEASTAAQGYKATAEQLNQTQEDYINNVADAIESGLLDEAEARALVRDGLGEQDYAEETTNKIMDEVNKTLNDRKEAAQAAAEAAAEVEESDRVLISTEEEMAAAIQPTIDKINALAAAYNEAYDSAYKSISGQFGLFEEAPEVVAASTEDMLKALESQISYINAYKDNLKFLSESGVSQELLSQLSDGSKESAGYVQAMVDDIKKNGGTAVDEISDKFSMVEQAKEDFSDTVAEMSTSFSEEMTKLQGELTATVESMDMSDEAAKAAESTMDAFAASAEGKVDKIKTAFEKAANAAKKALGIEIVETGSDSGTSGSSGSSGSDSAAQRAQEDEKAARAAEGAANEFTALSGNTSTANQEIETLGTESLTSSGHVAKFGELAGGAEHGVDALGAAAAAAAAILASIKAPSFLTGNSSLIGSIGSLFGFAGGTEYAPAGYAVVGEEGPEIVQLRGGERILDAQETQRTLTAMNAEPVNAVSASDGGRQYSIEYKPQYNISGSMNAEELQDVLDRHDAGMRDRLEEMLDDIENDRTRRKYA